jgi:SAM-dependent methyltransferase
MAQITSGIRAILSHPHLYELSQRIMGAHAFRKHLVEHYIRPEPGMAILDIGCGPAEILNYLPRVAYLGFDVSERYIDTARRVHGPRGRFECKQLTSDDVRRLEPMDVVLAIGLLHHLDDDQALEVMDLASGALAPGGRFVTVDPCLDPGQNPLARLLVKLDRGQNVRDRGGYEALAVHAFDATSVTVRHQSFIPYTHCIMVSTGRR